MLKQTKDSRQAMMALVILSAIGLAAIGVGGVAVARPAAMQRVPVTFSGGHDTDPRDHGRPVILVASALGVPAEAFRQAFAGVHPAPPGVQPTGDEQRANKAVLLSALARYGVTNERLDEVSDHYRYQRSLGGMWPYATATAYAVVTHDKIVRYVVTHGGSGYTSAPSIIVPGFPNAAAAAAVRLSFGENFSRNGSIASIAVARAQRSIQLPITDEPGSMMPPAPPPPPPPH